ncbi:MAG: hypothetical protein IJM97_06940 [Clostridia bacterium]|nr:hypothetical protein [Clostridia bacterium]
MKNLNFLPKTTDILPKHDLVFGSPINDESAGIPIGDGDTGSLVWLEADAIHININKTDLWDNSTDNSDCFCADKEENLTCLRHGGELVIKFNSPSFDMIYQGEFKEKLSLKDATINLHSETVFSKIDAEIFASNKNRVTALKCKFNSVEADEPTISLSRWGSKNLWRWYARTTHKPEAGLDGTEAFTEDNRIYITQKLNGTNFCLGLAIVTDSEHTHNKTNSHSGRFVLSQTTDCNFTLFYNISLGDSTYYAKEKTKLALDSAIAEGFEILHIQHKNEWEKFWNKSLVQIPHDYIENCYYLSLYYSNSECRGAYPPLFTNGLWGFRHDYSPWAYYFHYNMQHMYGPLEASGHGDLADNYYAMKRRGLDMAYLYAKKVKNMSGAFYHDVTDYLGRGARYDSHNCTPGSQVAMAMYRHYRMNGDEEFFKNTAYPVMKGAAEFYLGMLEKEADGLYHIHGTTAYEGTPPYHDTITDLVMIRALFSVMKDIVSEEEKSIYIDVLEHLPDYNFVPLDKDEVKDGKFLLGFGKGQDIHGDGLVLTIGKDDDGNLVRKNFGDSKREFYGFPDTEMSPVYPAGIFGLKDKNTPMFDAMYNQILLHREPEKCMHHWCMMPLYIARMGMAEELYEYLEKTISAWLVYPNGLGVDGPDGLADVKNRLKYNYVKNIIDGKCNTNTHNEAYGFRHFDMETLPIVAHAVCESLLQSYDGIIRICPANKKENPVSFCLYAEGGFKICADISEDNCNISIENMHGENCTVRLPDYVDESKIKFLISETGQGDLTEYNMEQNEDKKLFTLNFNKGDIILITDNRDTKTMPEIKPNEMWKTCINTHLGTPPLPGK